MNTDKQHAHALLDRVPADQMVVAVRFLEFLVQSPDAVLATVPIEDEEISDDENKAVARSKEWFKHHEGTTFEELVAEMGFTMEQIRSGSADQVKEPSA